MAEKKITKRERFAQLYSIVETSAVADKTDLLGFIDHEVELLDKKASAKGETKTQKENAGVKDTIAEVLKGFEHGVTVSEMLADSRLSGYTNQKISALLRQMVDSGVVAKTTDKKKSLFSYIG